MKKTFILQATLAMSEFHEEGTAYTYDFRRGSHAVPSGYLPYIKHIPDHDFLIKGKYRIFEDGRKTMLDIDGVIYLARLESTQAYLKIHLKPSSGEGVVLSKSYQHNQ